MNKEEILEGNKLIAEFLGHELDNNNEFDIEYITVQGLWETCSINDLEYNSSWDWLMPAISKITRDERFIEQENREYILDIVGYGHIEDTFEAVVTFIKWYNKEYEAN